MTDESDADEPVAGEATARLTSSPTVAIPLVPAPATGRPDLTVTESIQDLVSPALEGAKACLLVLAGRQLGQLFELTPERRVLGRSEAAGITIDDAGASREHASIHSSAIGYVLTDLQSTNGLFVNGKRVQRQVLREGDRIQIGSTTVLKFSYQDQLEEELRKRLYESATHDALTGLYNKRFFLESLEAAFAHAARRGAPLSVLVLDIDLFKQVNDQHGHLVGDSVLRQVASLIQKEVRTEDVLCRFGGEEFALLMRDAGPEPALVGAERIRSRMAEHVFEGPGELRLTVSIGVASRSSSGDSPLQLFAGADAALYEAKKAGRNRVVARPARPEQG